MVLKMKIGNKILIESIKISNAKMWEIGAHKQDITLDAAELGAGSDSDESGI